MECMPSSARLVPHKSVGVAFTFATVRLLKMQDPSL